MPAVYHTGVKARRQKSSRKDKKDTHLGWEGQAACSIEVRVWASARPPPSGSAGLNLGYSREAAFEEVSLRCRPATPLHSRTPFESRSHFSRYYDHVKKINSVADPQNGTTAGATFHSL
jgi:hypothetical protein